MEMTDKPHHRRLPDWEPYDRVTTAIADRLKTSGVSGDGWRTTIMVTLWFKGHAIVREFYNSYDFAIANLTALLAEKSCPIEEKVVELEKVYCDQAGCHNPAVEWYRLKRLFSSQGELLDAQEHEGVGFYYRQFCGLHLKRGDCSREDSDSNYINLPGDPR